MTDAENIARMFSEQISALIYNLRPDVIAYQKSKQHIIENCSFVEWEHDMCRRIPVCRKTNQYCSAQCVYGDIKRSEMGCG
jgi:hypothetical protein